MSKILNVAVLYGGKSTEHEVSVHSAQTVCRVLAKSGKYSVTHIFIDKQGRWFLQESCSEKTAQDKPVSPIISSKGSLLLLDENTYLKPDVYFPVLHGTNGEDGTLQGLLESLDAPYVGCGVLASAMGMDKEISKVAADRCSVAMLPYRKLSRGVAYDKDSLEKWAAQTGYPIFVKPARLGSSVGVTKVKTEAELHPAIEFAFRFDTDILVEKGVDNPREVFCALLGEGETVQTSECGELKNTAGEFFDYQAKYITQGGCETRVPADLPAQMREEIRQASAVIFQALRGGGLARVDFLIDGNGKAWFSEINTLPGMSETSLYPQLFEAAGVAYPQILDELIALAVRVHARKQELSLERAE